MSFSVPTFPLVASVYRGPWLTKVFALDSPANLANGRRVTEFQSGFDPQASNLGNLMQLLLPALTDVRDISCASENDVVEVPTGSGRWYGVTSVDDVGKSFPNEYRLASIVKIFEQIQPVQYAGLHWPAPIP